MFLVFVAVLFALSIVGMAVWWIYSKISIAISKRNIEFEIEKQSMLETKKEEKEND